MLDRCWGVHISIPAAYCCCCRVATCKAVPGTPLCCCWVALGALQVPLLLWGCLCPPLQPPPGCLAPRLPTRPTHVYMRSIRRLQPPAQRAESSSDPPSPPPHSRGVRCRGTRRHHPPSGHQTLTIPPQKQHSPNSHSWALCPMAASSMGTPTSPNPPTDTQGEENQEKQHPCAVVIHARLSPTGPNSHLGAQQSSLCPGKKGFRRWKTPLTHSSSSERLYPIRGKGEMRPLSAPGGPDPSSGHRGGVQPFCGSHPLHSAGSEVPPHLSLAGGREELRDA